MINRKELKAAAKNLIKPSYWKNVGAGLLLAIAAGAGCAYALSQTAAKNPVSSAEIQNIVANHEPMELMIAFGIALACVVSISLAGSLILKLLTLPMEVGCRRYFLKHRKGESNMKECLAGYTEDFGNVFGIMFIRDLKLALWSLLLFVPAIVKSYEYRMVPFLLAENPKMNRREAFARSKAMMMGHKMDAFKMDLSFLGWDLLGGCTFGLTDVFYKNPYKAAADVEFYESMCAVA